MKKILLIFLILFWGCNSRNDNNQSLVTNPKTGGTLNVALINDIDSFNPIVSDDISTGAVQDLLFPALTGTRWNDSLGYSGYEPLLASSWSINPEGNSVTFNLRKDVFWGNGKAVTINDIIYSYKLYSDSVSASPSGFLFENFFKNSKSEIDITKSITNINDSSFTLRYTSRIQNPMQLSILKIVPENYYGFDLKKLRDNPNGMIPPSAGPYKLEKWEANQRVILVKNDKYALGARPFIDKIVFKILPDYTSRLTDLKTGDIDFMEGIKPEDVKSLSLYQNLKTLALNGRNYEFICWSNIDNKVYQKTHQIKPHPLFGNKNVRKALTLAIDRQEIIDGFLGDYGSICNGPISPIFKWAYNTSIKPYQYDKQKAQQILADEGWIDHNNNGIIDKDGKEFEFSLYINAGNPRREFAANMIKNFLKKVGIEVKIEKLEWNLFETKIIHRELDAFINGMGVSSEINPFEFWYSDFKKAPMNDPGFRNKRVDELIQKGNKLKPLEAAPCWKEFQEIIHDEQPCTFLYWYANIIGYNNRVKNLKSNIWDSYNQITSWWLSE
jgi:peptide/nickel transport system substrate-binding protein